MKSIIFTIAVLFIALSAAADLRLPRLFSDHMVLQQEMSNTVWGWADPGEVAYLKEIRKNIKSVDARFPANLGLDTSLAHVALSLSRRNKDEYATKSNKSPLKYQLARQIGTYIHMFIHISLFFLSACMYICVRTQ